MKKPKILNLLAPNIVPKTNFQHSRNLALLIYSNLDWDHQAQKTPTAAQVSKIDFYNGITSSGDFMAV